MRGRYNKLKDICIAIALVCAISIVSTPDLVYAAGPDLTGEPGRENAYPSGDVLPLTLTPIEESDIDSSNFDGECKLVEYNYASAIYNSNWDKYSSNFFYNKLSDEEKVVWDRIDDRCYSYLAGSNVGKDFPRRGDYYTIEDVDTTVDGESIFANAGEIREFIYMYTSSNPQYYFLTNLISYTNNYSKIYLGVYDDFVDANDRAKATSKFQDAIDDWVSDIGFPASEEDKLSKAKLANDMVRDNVRYNDDVVASNSDGGSTITSAEEQAYHTQSAYSALVDGISVCAGYSECYAIICNALGIDGVCITSSTHEWNEIRVNNSWYNVDTTWSDTGKTYKYFMKSDKDYASDKPSNIKSHTAESFWALIKPVCTLSTGSTENRIGSLPEPLGQVETPVINVIASGSSYRVTITNIEAGAKVYYTIDGSYPSEASTKCNLLTLALTIDEPCEIIAIAIKDKYLDSGYAYATLGDGGGAGDITDDDSSSSGNSSNVIAVNANGTATVRDGVTGGSAVVPVSYINEGKVYRMYDSHRGEHFYTKNDTEARALMEAGWTHEADADFTVVDAYDDDAIPVYRLYNPNDGGIHFYTQDAAEARKLRSVGWNYEGISHYVYAASSTKGKSQYRLYNPNSSNGEHNWTADISEYYTLIIAGWKDEGVSWKIL